MTDELKKYQGKPVKQLTTGLFSGMIAVDLEDIVAKNTIDWHGKPMQSVLWEMIKAFMLWTYNEHKTEGQLRLYYSESRGLWAAHPMPQYIAGGLFTEEIKDSPEADKINAKFNPMVWHYMGTVHHHCGAGAFQSGTDHKDELSKPGLHVTLGGLSGDIWSIHARCSLRGLLYDVNLSQWLPETENIKKPTCSFPSHWKACLVEKPKPAWSKGSQGEFWRSNYGSGWNGYDDHYGFDRPGTSGWDRFKKLAEMPSGGTGKIINMRDIEDMEDEEFNDLEEMAEDKLLVESIEENFYMCDDSTKRLVFDVAKRNSLKPEDVEDILEIYNVLDTCLNGHGIDDEDVVQLTFAMLAESLPYGRVLAVNKSGGIQVTADCNPNKLKKIYPMVPCIACEGTGYRSTKKEKGMCGVCKGRCYVPKKDEQYV